MPFLGSKFTRKLQYVTYNGSQSSQQAKALNQYYLLMTLTCFQVVLIVISFQEVVNNVLTIIAEWFKVNNHH